MIVSPDALRKDTVALIAEINKELDIVRALIANEADRLGSRRDPSAYPDRLATLLQAKASAYNSLILLQTGESQRPRSGPPPRPR